MAGSLKDKNSEIVAKRWAHALMELVQENSEISKEEVLDDLREVVENLEASEELKSVVNNPAVSVEEKQIVICKLFENKIMPIVYNFLYVLNLKKRFGIVGDIALAFEKELDELKNIVNVKVISAIEIEDSKKDEIKSKIAEKLNKNVNVSWEIRSDIIAGLIFNIDETIIDNSVKHKLENLSKNIIKG